MSYFTSLTKLVHERGVPVAQKNAPELAKLNEQTGADFVVIESCTRYNECEHYLDAFGEAVFMIEYERESYRRACEKYGEHYAILFRDSNFWKPGDPGYEFDLC